MNLTIYDFSKIMTDIASLIVTDFHLDKYYQPQSNEMCYRFHWEWHKYSGSGVIYLVNGKIDVCNKFCEQSSLSISQHSIRQAVKHISEVYNEHALVNVLQYIADINIFNKL